MRRAQRSLLFITAALVFASTGVFAAPLQSIQVAGNKRIESDAILEKMSLKAGSEPTSEAVASDIRSIFSLGFFEDIRFERDGGRLVVRVRERPVVTEIAY